MNLETTMDSELAAAFATFPAMDILSDIHGTRQGFVQMFGGFEVPSNTPVNIYDLTIPGSNALSDIPVRVYRLTSATQSVPALLWIHGGGFLIGEPKVDDNFCSRVVEEVGCVVVSVDYRLAPEHPFPAAPEDCYKALQWIVESAMELGVDTRRLAVGGASAGGCLAAAVTLMARDRNGPQLSFQLLRYPCLDDRHNTPSSLAVTDGRVWNRATSMAAWKLYLGTDHQNEVSPYAAPARAVDLSILPPAYILVADLDLLRDEAIDYAQRLMQSGIRTELQVFPGTFHGFDVFIPGAAISIRARDEEIRALKHAIG